jgi:hypothetical protein
VSRATIKDKNYITIGYIETMHDGTQKAMDRNYVTLGYFDPRRDVTEDRNHVTIANGNVVSALIYKA